MGLGEGETQLVGDEDLYYNFSMNQDIRWRQRFDNFQNSLLLLQESINKDELSELERAGVLQFFEMSLELAWKMLKDYLSEQGFSQVKTPRDAIKQAFQSDLIGDGDSWLQMLSDRNLSAHVYDEATIREIVTRVKENHAPLLSQLHEQFKNIADESSSA